MSELSIAKLEKIIAECESLEATLGWNDFLSVDEFLPPVIQILSDVWEIAEVIGWRLDYVMRSCLLLLNGASGNHSVDSADAVASVRLIRVFLQATAFEMQS